ncbi:histidine kinase [Nocardiopsis sp. TSRI0078]|uniref:sensor histidine kinase n=1 Tax=unclassified Nocardiopsis TaxID=2649073 RepID=UPI00093EB2CA|nr:histidine kinase [Nocardiopsis sp. TSRI0078]OKI23548.1 histidine kinase [Nocardiopsis sp. TSRI0078]
MNAMAVVRRRGARDWIVDSSAFLLALLFALASAAKVTDFPSAEYVLPAWLRGADALLTLLACLSLWWRRRWPVQIAVALVLFAAVSGLVSGAMLIALFTLAVHRPPRTSLAVYGLSVGAAFVNSALWPDPHAPFLVIFLLGAALQGAVTGWGLTVHHRRKLVESLRDRAVHAETEAQLRAEHAQHQVREAMAREIHDVLGHRLSLLSVHAGALEYRPDASAEEVARSAKVIRESAHQALQDLREVIGVLRAPVGELPQPTMADLQQLVEEADEAGARVEFVEEYDGTVPERIGRTAYRIVQEGLTNVRKHAPGADTRVLVGGAPGDGLAVEVRNGPSPGPAPAAAGGDGRGQGLAGLDERVSLVSGRLEHGPDTGGGWRLSAWLPWPV